MSVHNPCTKVLVGQFWYTVTACTTCTTQAIKEVMAAAAKDKTSQKILIIDKKLELLDKLVEVVR